MLETWSLPRKVLGCFFQSAAPRRLIFALLSSMHLLRRILTEHRRNPSNIGTASDTIFDEMTLSIRS
jgi:hypothetical protein